MTEAQLADLDGVGSGSDEMWLEPALAALPRLLEERKRLLDALRECVELVSVDDYWNDKERHCAESAIAYAEEST